MGGDPSTKSKKMGSDLYYITLERHRRHDLEGARRAALARGVSLKNAQAFFGARRFAAERDFNALLASYGNKLPRRAGYTCAPTRLRLPPGFHLDGGSTTRLRAHDPRFRVRDGGATPTRPVANAAGRSGCIVRLRARPRACPRRSCYELPFAAANGDHAPR